MRFILPIILLAITTYSSANPTEKNNYTSIRSLDFSLPNDLPLIVVPATVKTDQPLLFYISGDGGWNDFSKAFADQLSQKGFTVIGLDARKYFWDEKTPEQTTADITRTIDLYLQQFGKTSFVLAGYSFGAGVAPFVASRLNNNLKSKMKSVAILSPDLTADFEIHVSDMLGFKKSKEKYDVLAEMKKLEIYKPICFFGDKEDKSTTNAFKQAGIRTIILPGNHHYADNYALITNNFIAALKK